jgi:hypothetical protein
MFETQVELEGQSLVLRALHNLSLRSADRADVWLRLPRGVESDVAVETDDAVVEITLRESAEVEIPADTPVRVIEARGNLALKSLIGEVDVVEVHGNLRARDVGALRVASTVRGNLKVDGGTTVEIGQVRGNARLKAVGDAAHLGEVAGNLAAARLAGGLEVGTVRGNAALSRLDGPARIGRVGGNLAAHDLAGGLEVEAIGGNLALQGPWAPGQTYRASAGGNAAVTVGPEDSARVRIEAGGHVVTTVPLSPVDDAPGWQAGVVGDGEAELEFRAGANLVLGGDNGSGVGETWTILGAEMAHEAVRAAMQRLQTRLERVDWDRAGRKAERAVERAASRVERKLERMERKLERTARHWDHPEPPSPEPVERTDDRPPGGRLDVLERLSQQQISVQEALELLRN